MTILLSNVNSNQESASVAASGSVIFAITGTFSQGLVTITGDIGTGEVPLWVCESFNTRKMIGLGLKPGVTFKANTMNLADSDSVTVAYINV